MGSAFRSWLSCLVFLAISLAGSAQVKYEQEFRVKEDQVPAEATAYLAGIPFERKVKWFKEISQDGVSFEAKSKLRGQKFSIEFDTLGYLEDIEIDIEENEVPSASWRAINDYFLETFDKTKVEKIQKQWTGDPMKLREMLETGDEVTGHVTRYEIVLRGFAGGKPKLYELLFDSDGRNLKKLEIVPRYTDNLDF